MFDNNKILNAMEKCLNDSEKSIFQARHGIESVPMTLQQLCSEFNISRDVLRSIESKVIRYLKQERN
ncbi:sigma factor-like helix-turn-helix DNA-binding protein [Desulfosporosinus sp. PR]|nr:sigma factor-like helix-turn-helix DNA-binding protein [Desulfosporosinus sp. PR]